MENKSKFLFVKWFIVFSATIAASCIAASLGFFSLVLASDISHLSSVIAVLFVTSSILAGKLSYEISSGLISTVSLKRKLKFLNFMADAFFTLGLLGTIVGFCYMMYGTLNSGAGVDVAQIIAQLKVGASTKLYATLAGILSSLLLQLQILIIEIDLITE
jgi:hypothetical protein